MFVAQLDASNQWIWAVSAGGSGDDIAMSLQFGADETPIIGMTIQEMLRWHIQCLFTWLQ